MFEKRGAPSRYARIEEAVSDTFTAINRVINRINRDFELGDFTSENRARYPWATDLESPEPYASRLWEYPWAILESMLEPGVFCADIGCGQTPFTIYLKEVAGCNVIGFDSHVGEYSPGRPYWGVSDEFARKTGLQFVRSNLQCIEWPDNSFDRVFCISVIEHIPSRADQATGMREIARILKPGGLALISVDVNLKQRVVEPLTLIWESGLSIYDGKIDLTVPGQRFGIFNDGKQPADVFGFVLYKPDTKIRTQYGDDSPLIEAWRVCYLRDTFAPSYQSLDYTLESIRHDLERNNRPSRPASSTLLRIAAKILLRRYPGIR